MSASSLSGMSEPLPNPAFEGSEKRIEVIFGCQPGGSVSPRGLRSLPRRTLDCALEHAACEIVSCISNDSCDAYVLSESSLFVYEAKWVLKTCGTTKLLESLPVLLDAAASLGLRPDQITYSRASFLFPDLQPPVYRSFSSEVDRLESLLQPHGLSGHAHVLGSNAHGLQWHVFASRRDHPCPAFSPHSTTGDHAAHPGRDVLVDESEGHCGGRGSDNPEVSADGLCTVEICMTGLSAAGTQSFFRTPKFVSSRLTTEETGIARLVPGAELDDYVFEPCGYSMNGIQGEGFMTIHVTPEPECTYASCELHNLPAATADPSALVSQVAAIFQPQRVAVAVRMEPGECVTGMSDAGGGEQQMPAPEAEVPGYACLGADCARLAAGRVAFYSFAVEDSGSDRSSFDSD